MLPLSPPLGHQPATDRLWIYKGPPFLPFPYRTPYRSLDLRLNGPWQVVAAMLWIKRRELSSLLDLSARL